MRVLTAPGRFSGLDISNPPPAWPTTRRGSDAVGFLWLCGRYWLCFFVLLGGRGIGGYRFFSSSSNRQGQRSSFGKANVRRFKVDRGRTRIGIRSCNRHRIGRGAFGGCGLRQSFCGGRGYGMRYCLQQWRGSRFGFGLGSRQCELCGGGLWPGKLSLHGDGIKCSFCGGAGDDLSKPPWGLPLLVA